MAKFFKSKKVRIILLIIIIIILIALGLCKYLMKDLAFEIAFDASIVLTLSLNVSFYAINVSITNNYQIGNDIRVVNMVEPYFDKIKQAIAIEGQKERNFKTCLYEIAIRTSSEFSLSKYGFASEELQKVFDEIKSMMNKIIKLYQHFSTTHVVGDMSNEYVQYRNELSILIDKFYLKLQGK